jgi:hypothetical protein
MIDLVTLALIAATGWGVAPNPPAVPQPDFVTPVDYLAWYDEATRYAATDNALTRYGVLFYGAADNPLPKLAPAPDTFAARDLEKLFKVPLHWEPERKRGLAQWTQRVGGRFSHVILGARDHEFYATRRRPDLELLADLTPPALGNARWVCQALFASAWQVRESTIFADQLNDAMRASLILARHVGQGATLDEQLFAAGHRRFVYDQIRRSLNSPLHAAEQWEDVVATLEKYDRRSIPADYARSMHFAEVAALQLLQHFCMQTGDDGQPKLTGKINMDRVNAYVEREYPGGRFKPAGIERLADADPRELARQIHAYYAGAREILNLAVAGDVSERVTRLEGGILGAHPELNLLISPLGLSVRSAFRTEAERRLTYVFLRMAIQFKYTDEWPVSIAKFVPEDDRMRGIDPYTGKAFLLRKVGPTQIPYSVGPDGQDDGGDERNDIIVWGRVAPEAYYRGKKNTDDANSNGAPTPAKIPAGAAQADPE